VHGGGGPWSAVQITASAPTAAPARKGTKDREDREDRDDRDDRDDRNDREEAFMGCAKVYTLVSMHLMWRELRAS
jgi:hypothetical protein